MYLVKFENEDKTIILDAEEFKTTNDREYVYFYKNNKQIALLKMEKVRAIFKNDTVNKIL